MTKEKIIEILEGAKDRNGDVPFEIAVKAISKMAENIPKWIPASERLPDQFGWDENYLVALAWGGVGVMEYKSTGWHIYGSFSPVPFEVVTAWMPLPEAYREEGD